MSAKARSMQRWLIRRWHSSNYPMKRGTAVATVLSLLLAVMGALAGVVAIVGWGTSNEQLIGPIWSAAILAIAAKVWTRRKPETGVATWHALALLLFLFPAMGALCKWSWFPEPWPDLAAGAVAAFIVVMDDFAGNHKANSSAKLASTSGPTERQHQQAPRREGGPARSEPSR